VRYADVGDSAVLSAIAIERARLVVAANGAHPSTRRMIDHLRQFHPGVPVVVAVPYLAQRDELRRSGTGEVFALAPEGVLSFGRQVLDRLGVGAVQAEAIVRSLNADDYAVLRRGVVGGAAADERI
jgi:voltage-gated potassium channel Kch